MNRKKRKSNECSFLCQRQQSLEQTVVSPDGSRVAVIGANGYIDLLSTRTSQWQGALKMNDTARAAVFAHDVAHRMFTAGREGVVYEWDLRMYGAVSRWREPVKIYLFLSSRND